MTHPRKYTYKDYVRDYKALRRRYPLALPKKPLSKEEWEKVMDRGA